MNDAVALRELVRHARAASGIDFAAYRSATIARRAAHRMQLCGAPTLGRYAELVAHDAAERWRLVDALLVKTTRPFRDPEVWTALRDELLPELVARCAARGSTQLRAWVAGCATGEEAWTVAMCLLEARERAGADLDVRVVATDVDPAALERTARGTLSAASADDVPPELRSRFVVAEGARLRVSSELRACISTERHDLLGERDAPAISVVRSFDLVCCRNVLLYFVDAGRRRAFGRLVSACERGGLLVLGESEAAPQPIPEGLVRVKRRIHCVT